MMQIEIEDRIDVKTASLSEKLSTLVTLETIDEEQVNGETEEEYTSGELMFL